MSREYLLGKGNVSVPMTFQFPKNKANSMDGFSLHVDLFFLIFRCVVRISNVVEVFRLFALGSLFELGVLGWLGGFFSRTEAHAE